MMQHRSKCQSKQSAQSIRGGGNANYRQKLKARLIANFYREKSGSHQDFIGGGVRIRSEDVGEMCGQSSDCESAILCTKETQLYNANGQDNGWGCGYRNCQMILSSVLSNGQTIPGFNGVPNIPDLQQVLESAWANGFDPDGAAQLGHRVVGTRKWIGTTEVYCILAYLNIKCHIIDFHSPTNDRGEHEGMFEFAHDYFAESAVSDGIQFTKKHPLYLQHQGHSRTIIGVEFLKVRNGSGSGSFRLLTLDPDIHIFQGDNPNDTLRSLELRVSRTKCIPQFQILYIDTGDSVCDDDKIIKSQRIP